MTPEAEARKKIDEQLAACGRQVQDRSELNIFAQRGVAVREFPVEGGEADYLRYTDGKAIGVVEAKPEGHGGLTGVEASPSTTPPACRPRFPLTGNRCRSTTRPQGS